MLDSRPEHRLQTPSKIYTTTLIVICVVDYEADNCLLDWILYYSSDCAPTAVATFYTTEFTTERGS